MDSILTILKRGPSTVLSTLRGDAESDGNREIRERIERDNAEWEAKKKLELERMRMPTGALGAAGLAASARVNQYASGVKKLLRQEPKESRQEIKEKMAPVREAYPKSTYAAEFATDMLMTAPVGLGAGAATAKGLGAVYSGASPLLARGVTGLGMGAAEGATLGIAEENMIAGTGVGAGIGMAAEMALPPVFRGLGSAANRFVNKYANDLIEETADGALKATPALKEALRKVGLTADDIANVDLSALPKNMTPDQTAAAALFTLNKTPTSRSRITNRPEDFATEAMIARGGGEGADVVRQRAADEAGAIQRQLTELTESLGVSGEAGDSIKTSLQGLYGNKSKAITAAYLDFAEVVGDTGAAEIPLARNLLRLSINEVMYGTKPVEDVTRNAIKRLAAKFGLLGDKPVKKGFNSTVRFNDETITFTGKQTPLNLGNFEELRKGLNQAFQGDRTGSVSSVIKAVDDTVLKATDDLAKLGDSRKGVREFALRARETFTDRIERFEIGTIVPKLLNENPKTGTPFIEASQVTKKIFAPGTPPEDVDRLITTLWASQQGKVAVNNLRAATVMQLTDKGFVNSGKLTGGQTPFDITAYSAELRRIGAPKLERIFGKDSGMLKAVYQLEEMGKKMRTPSGAAAFEGADTDMAEAAIRAARLYSNMGGNVLGLAIANFFGKTYKSAGDTALTKQIIGMTGLNAQKGIEFMTQSYPSLAVVLGLTTAGTKGVIEDGR